MRPKVSPLHDGSSRWGLGPVRFAKQPGSIVVLVEHAGAGGAKAAPIAQILLDAYARKQKEVDPT